MEENRNEMDFAAMFEARERGNVHIRTGEKVSGRVIQVGKDTVFVDLGARADGILDKLDFADGKGGFNVQEGDCVEAYCMGWTNEGIKLQMRMSAGKAHETDSSVEEAYAAKMPIEGKVTEERKGGFSVQISKTSAFCPFSQIDARGVRKEPVEYIGQTFLFKITEYGEEGHNVVLSRRAILEQETAKARATLAATLQEGDIRTATVVKIMPFGAFVDLGGIEGLVHVSEMSWNRGLNPEDIVSTGQQVTVKVLKLEWAEGDKKERISLSIKQAAGDPWESFAADERFVQGARINGKVMRLADIGAFIQILPGVDGFAHISQLNAGKRVAHPSEVLTVGDTIEVTILGIDFDRKRIALCLGEPAADNAEPARLNADEEKQVAAATEAGQLLEGEIESLKPFGLFVKLPNGQTGLLHISQINLPETGSTRERILYRTFPVHSKINVIVKEVDGKRISLTLPETRERERELERTDAYDVKDIGSTSFGNLGDIFGGLKL